MGVPSQGIIWVQVVLDYPDQEVVIMKLKGIVPVSVATVWRGIAVTYP